VELGYAVDGTHDNSCFCREQHVAKLKIDLTKASCSSELVKSAEKACKAFVASFVAQSTAMKTLRALARRLIEDKNDAAFKALVSFIRSSGKDLIAKRSAADEKHAVECDVAKVVQSLQDVRRGELRAHKKRPALCHCARCDGALLPCVKCICILLRCH
jgi:hypothetical protein